MTQEKFEEASKIQEEIGRLNLLIKYIEDKDEKDFPDTMHFVFNIGSDFLYLINLIGVNNALGFMRTRKRMLEKEFEEL